MAGYSREKKPFAYYRIHKYVSFNPHIAWQASIYWGFYISPLNDYKGAIAHELLKMF